MCQQKTCRTPHSFDLTPFAFAQLNCGAAGLRWTVFQDDPRPSDVKQGDLADCWYKGFDSFLSLLKMLLFSMKSTGTNYKNRSYGQHASLLYGSLASRTNCATNCSKGTLGVTCNNM